MQKLRKQESRALQPGQGPLVVPYLGASFDSCYGRGGEGDGTPLQYSCLENPMDGGAW